MKYLKFFENNDPNGPNVGDYVIINIHNGLRGTEFNEMLREFLDTNIGKILAIEGSEYIVEYKKVPYIINAIFFINTIKYNSSMKFHRNSIKYWSKYKKDCETYLMTNKYNL